MAPACRQPDTLFTCKPLKDQSYLPVGIDPFGFSKQSSILSHKCCHDLLCGILIWRLLVAIFPT